MSRKYKFHNPEGVYFVSFAVQGWVDIFTRNSYKNILVENLKYCQNNKGLEIFAWCIMTNHVHLIVPAKEGCSLPDIFRDYKKRAVKCFSHRRTIISEFHRMPLNIVNYNEMKFTSKEIKKAISKNYRESRKEWLLAHFETKEGFRFWRGDNKPVELWINNVIDQKIDYIHQNPVEEGLVFKAENYV